MPLWGNCRNAKNLDLGHAVVRHMCKLNLKHQIYLVLKKFEIFFCGLKIGTQKPSQNSIKCVTMLKLSEFDCLHVVTK